MEESRVFKIEDLRPIKDGYTISRDLKMGNTPKITIFSLGRDTDISKECYDTDSIYIGIKGSSNILIGDMDSKEVFKGNSIIHIDKKTLLGFETNSGIIYLEIVFNKEGDIFMNDKIKTNEVFNLKNLIDYEEGSIVNLDIVRNKNLKYVLMAFDKGTGLTPHRAPGNAILFCLEGKAIIGYEGKDYEITEGECFRFEKNGLHSVTANEKFKMALLLVME